MTDVLERIAVVVAQLLLKTEKVTIGVQGITILKTIESREGNLTIEELNHSCFLALEGHLIEGETILETHALNMNSL